jgi:hypothetical protein
MAFDIEGARKAGYSDAEIADHLAKSSGFDAVGARKSGYSDAELIEHLSKKTAKTEPAKPVEKSFGQKAIEFVEPTVEALGAVGGGALGLASPIPGGTAIGAGLGYGLAKGGVRAAKQFLGYEQPRNALSNLTQGAQDVLIGGSMEAGGQIVAPYLAKAAGWATDAVTGTLGKVRAARIANESLGPDREAVINALRSAPEGQTASQATADINSPTWQALAQRSAARDPRFFGSGMTPTQLRESTTTLGDLAGGTNQTQMRSAAEGAVRRLNDDLIPTLKNELDVANIAGVKKPLLEGQANRFGEAAASKVEDVRRFTAAGVRAGERAANTTLVPGYPMVPGRYTYMGELEKRAEQVAQQAADASLPFGEASRFAQSAADSLAAHGLKPLEFGAIQNSIVSTLKKPEFAGNKDVSAVLKRVVSDVAEWTGNGGVIDAYALDSIRKNSVNGAIRELYPAADKNVQKELAASMLTKVKSLIVDAIENAGGAGYGKYLSDYATGRQAINQTKLGAKASEMFKTNPKSFVELVEGNDPATVEKIFGPGNYEIVKEMSAEAMSKLKGVADVTKRTLEASSQASLGQTALREILEKNNPKVFKIPWGLSPKTMALNRALDVAEKSIGNKTMNALTEGMKSGKSAEEMLKVLPAKERTAVLNALSNPALFPGVSASSMNALGMND